MYTHSHIVARMTVINQLGGIASFDPGTPEILTQRSRTFTNRRFSNFTYGTKVDAVFSVSNKTRFLLNVRLFEEIAPKPQSQPQEPNPLRPEISNKWINGVFFTKEAALIFETAIKLAKTSPFNLLMIGPSGYGKTTLPMAIANQYGMKYVRINCAAIRDPEEWFGYREARDGSTVFVPTAFTEAVRDGNAIIVLDEFNRIEPWLHNTLYPLLDDARETIVHSEHIKCGPNLIFVATINEGTSFTGTFALDAAITNRMDAVLPVKPLPPSVEIELIRKRYRINETQAGIIVTTMHKLRKAIEYHDIQVDASTRSSLKIAKLVSSGMVIREAFEFAIVNGVPVEQQKNLIDLIAELS